MEAFNEIIEWADRYDISEKILPRDIEKLKELKKLDFKNHFFNKGKIEELPNPLEILQFNLP